MNGLKGGNGFGWAINLMKRRIKTKKGGGKC